jgi:haloacetate dehalogenase
MFMWHLVADRLAQDFTVVMADLRGYGDSGKPPTDSSHEPYSKRAMAFDMAQLMDYLGHETFHLVGHDRGGRVSHRLARDHPAHVQTLTVLDIAPTATMYAATDMAFARAYYHWFFLIQPAPLPETLIGGNPEYYLRHKIGSWGFHSDAHTPEALADYLRCFTPETIHASCEDYRAAATIDLIHDADDANKKLTMPVLALWADKGFVGKTYDVVAEWQKVAENVRGSATPSGHFIPEEAPEAFLDAFYAFLSGQ